MHDITNTLFNFSQTLKAKFTCKAREEQDVVMIGQIYNGRVGE